MGNKTINDLAALTGVASGDYVAMWDVSGSVTRKVTLSSIFDLLLAQASTFTNTITIAPTSTGASGLIVNQPAGTTNLGLRIQLAGTSYVYALYPGHANAASGAVIQADWDGGNNLAGPYLEIGRNTNATKAGAGFIRLRARGGSAYRVWIDNAGVARVHTADPIFDNDTAGTVIGAQTSSLDSKNILGDVGDPLDALRAIVAAAKTGLKRFDYKSGAFGGEEFEGIVTDFAPRYGMDRDEAHPAGKSLNEIQLLGDLIRSVALIAEKLGLTEE